MKPILLLLLLCATLPAYSQVTAGAARIEITPDVKAMRVPLGGYAARRDASSTGVDAPIFARSLVITQGMRKVGVVSVDLCFLPASIKEEVLKRTRLAGCNLSAETLLLSATHTHTAPDPLAMHAQNHFEIKGWVHLNPQLLAFTADKIAEAVVMADKKRTPAKFGSRSRMVDSLSHNRRGDPLIDREMAVLRVSASNDTPIAEICNFAAHPTLYDDTMLEISPDWCGVMTSQVEQEMGGVCLFLNGAEGDSTTQGAEGDTPKARIQSYGGKVAQVAISLLKATPVSEKGTLRAWLEEVDLPERKPSGLFIAAAAQLGATFTQAKELVRVLMPSKAHLAFLQIGDLLLMGFPCEPTGEIGLAAKAYAKRAGFRLPIVVALSNEWLSYCVSPAQYRAGKYEASMCFYGENFGTVLLKGVESGLKR